MTFGLLASLTLLGLAAIDPVGLAAMPILLSQKNPIRRSYAFLGGSLCALMVMGLVFAKGAGVAVLQFEADHSWIVPTVEIFAGLVLLAIAATLVWQIKTGRDTVKGPGKLANSSFTSTQLFIFGGELVVIQSLVDVVFIIAMIKVGQLHMSLAGITLATAAYAVPALVFQLLIVVAYQLTPQKHQTRLLRHITRILTKNANKTIAYISFGLGLALLVNGILTLTQSPHI